MFCDRGPVGRVVWRLLGCAVALVFSVAIWLKFFGSSGLKMDEEEEESESDTLALVCMLLAATVLLNIVLRLAIFLYGAGVAFVALLAELEDGFWIAVWWLVSTCVR